MHKVSQAKWSRGSVQSYPPHSGGASRSGPACRNQGPSFDRYIETDESRTGLEQESRVMKPTIYMPSAVANRLSASITPTHLAAPLGHFQLPSGPVRRRALGALPHGLA